MFVVTGTPRSATGYAAMLFRAINVRCAHENVFRPRTTLHDVLRWYRCEGDFVERQGESSWLAWAWLPVLPGPVPVLHTTRDPWVVIDSLSHRNDLLPEEAKLSLDRQALRDIIRAYCPEAFDYRDSVNRAAAFVVRWNELVEITAQSLECPYLRYRVEDLDVEMVRRILSHVGLERYTQDIERALADVPHNVNGGKQIAYNVEITNPLILAHLKETEPNVTPVISRAMTAPKPLGRTEIEPMLKPDLRMAVVKLAQSQGYRS